MSTGRGLLDTLSDVADNLFKEKPQRKSVLHAFKFKVSVSVAVTKPVAVASLPAA